MILINRFLVFTNTLKLWSLKSEPMTFPTLKINVYLSLLFINNVFLIFNNWIIIYFCSSVYNNIYWGYLYSINTYDIISCCVVLHCIVLNCIELYCTVLHYIVLYWIVMYCIALNWILLYCTMLCCVVLCFHR